MRGKKSWWLAAALAVLGVVFFGLAARMVDAQSAGTPVNLTGMWVFDYANGKKGWMSIVYQPSGSASYLGRFFHPDFGETAVKGMTAREMVKLGQDIMFLTESSTVQWIIFEKIASPTTVSGKIMSQPGGLFPGNTNQIRFMAQKG